MYVKEVELSLTADTKLLLTKISKENRIILSVRFVELQAEVITGKYHLVHRFYNLNVNYLHGAESFLGSDQLNSYSNSFPTFYRTQSFIFVLERTLY
jgi:hypothetical protein